MNCLPMKIFYNILYENATNRHIQYMERTVNRTNENEKKNIYTRITMLCVQIVQVSTKHEQADYGGGGNDGDGDDDAVDGASH